MSRLTIFKELWGFLKARKKWWLAPVITFLILLGALLVFFFNYTATTFIYTLF